MLAFSFFSYAHIIPPLALRRTPLEAAKLRFPP
jgi:hypothetical protein